MKRTKDRLHRVIVIGATPAGIAATNKLGELGVPVTLIESDPDLDKKLSKDRWKLASGVHLNYAYRPGLLRLLRNPNIQTILPGRITSLKHTPQGFRAVVRRLQTYIDPDHCTLCGRCIEICPVTTPNGGSPIQFAGRRSLPGRPVIQKAKQPLCQSTCPLGVNAQAYIALARKGRFREALEVVRRDNVLPGICGRVCTHPCEEACRRGELDQSIAIRDIKRFLADYELAHPNVSESGEISQRPEKIAVIGSGPAGLTAAAEFARLGYHVKVFEKEAEPGGLLRYGIGSYRLPRDILDHEIDLIRKMGVEFETSHPIDLPDGLMTLGRTFDKVIVTVGAGTDRPLGVPGSDLEGVEGCLSFLNRVYNGGVESVKGEVAVIGDGNSAFDLARVVRRLGANVTIVSWFPKDLIPADKEEIRGALDEGISIIDHTQVTSFEGKNGKLSHLRCSPTEPGEPDKAGIPWPVIVPASKPFDLTFDHAFVAIGQAGVLKGDGDSSILKLDRLGHIDTDESFQTSLSSVYGAGDGMTGPSSVVEAMASGRAAARSVHKELSGEDLLMPGSSRPDEIDFMEIPADIPSLARPTMPERQSGSRCEGFSEVALGLNESQVLFESERCLQCGICSECLACEEVCSQIGAIKHQEQEIETIEQGGVVIIADPEAAPHVKGEDVIRAYGPKAAKPDTHAMITRGYAAAARTMILLEGSLPRKKGHGVSFSPPDPELSPQVRIGVFACRCNDSFGWLGEMDEYVTGLCDRENIIHAEVVPSACTPEGSAGILRIIREKGITRVVLASCVCCPLDFVCSACTDQRSRLKDNLFNGTGVSRSMVETCNLRGEVLRHISNNPQTALALFKGLVDRSIQRARRLRSLPSPARTYNFTIAVIGESEAAVNSALTLADSGFEVFMFGTSEGSDLEQVKHPNIHCFCGTVVKGMTGTLGDFKVFVESNGSPQVFQVGTIIVGEKQRRMIPYIQQEGLPKRIVASSMQKRGRPDIPFLHPGTTSIQGLFLASPPGIHISERRKGDAAAVLAAAIMPRGPRQSKGYTVVVDEARCRGCGRCIQVCAYQAITFTSNEVHGWSAVVDEALCKGCGNCISVCPTNAADSPYRDQIYLEQLLEEVLVQ